MMAVFVDGVDMSENGQALDAIRTNEPGTHYLGSAHTLANFETAFYRSDVTDNNSFEQWQEDGSLDAAQRANAHLEEDAGRVRGAADRPRRRRGAARLHRPAQGVDAGFGGLAPRALPPPLLADAGPVRRRSPGSCSAPTFELVPLKNALDQADFLPAGATVSVTASPAKGIEATVALCEQLQARGFRAVPHLSARMIRDRAHLVRADRLARGRRRRSRLRRRWRRQGAGRLPGRALAPAGDGRDRSSAGRDRDPGLPAGPRLHRRCAAARGAPGQGGLRQLHDDAALLRPERDRVLAGRPASRGHHAPGPPRPAGRRRAAAAAGDQRPDRGRRHAPVPGQEHAVHRPPDPVRRLLPARTACSRGSHRTSPTRPTGSSTCTSTRSTPSTSPSAGGRPTWSGCGSRPPPDPSAPRPCSSRPRGAPWRHNRRASYQEWRRDRPVEATTTYRHRAGKVPSPGRSSCTIRELPSRPFRAGRVLSYPVPPPDHPLR